MLVQEIENIKDLRIVRKGVVQSIHFEQSDNILNYETQEFIKMIKRAWDGRNHERLL